MVIQTNNTTYIFLYPGFFFFFLVSLNNSLIIFDVMTNNLGNAWIKKTDIFFETEKNLTLLNIKYNTFFLLIILFTWVCLRHMTQTIQPKDLDE